MGHIISDKGIKPEPDKITTIINMPTPRSKSDLLRIIGIINYLSPFCQNPSSVMHPRRALTKDRVEFVWSKFQDDALTKAKKLISSTPTLMYYDLQKHVVLQVNASERGLGGALLQPNNDSKL